MRHTAAENINMRIMATPTVKMFAFLTKLGFVDKA